MYFDFVLFIIINLYIFARGARKLFPRHIRLRKKRYANHSVGNLRNFSDTQVMTA